MSRVLSTKKARKRLVLYVLLWPLGLLLGLSLTYLGVQGVAVVLAQGMFVPMGGIDSLRVSALIIDAFILMALAAIGIIAWVNCGAPDGE